MSSLAKGVTTMRGGKRLRHGRSRRRGQREERLFFKNAKRRGCGSKPRREPEGKRKRKKPGWKPVCILGDDFARFDSLKCCRAYRRRGTPSRGGGSRHCPSRSRQTRSGSKGSSHAQTKGRRTSRRS